MFGMQHLLVDLCQSYSHDAPWDQTCPTPRVTSWKQRNKDVEFICGENDSGERPRAIMALLYKYEDYLYNSSSA